MTKLVLLAVGICVSSSLFARLRVEEKDGAFSVLRDGRGRPNQERCIDAFFDIMSVGRKDAVEVSAFASVRLETNAVVLFESLKGTK